MSLTRKDLKEIKISEGQTELSDEQINEIINHHISSISGLQDTISELRDKLSLAEADATELNTLKNQFASLQSEHDDYKTKYEQEHNNFEEYKNSITAKEQLTAKESAVRKYFESKNITGSRLNIAMKGAKSEISQVELDGDKIKDTAILDELINGDYSSLVTSRGGSGVSTSTPPSNNGGATMTKEEILAIRDGSERRKAIAENPKLFGLNTEN